MSPLLLLALAALLHPSQGQSPVDGIPFDITIEEAYIYKLGKDITHEFYKHSGDHNQRLSKSLDDNKNNQTEFQSNTTDLPIPRALDIPSLRYLDDEGVASLALNTTCGFCKGRLNWGDIGVIQSPNFPEPYGPNMDCLWLLMTADEDARIRLVCDTIQLESCGAQNGFAPTWRDYLIVSPLWNFKKSWVYCGHATTLTSITHTSICDQMAVTFRSNANENGNVGFRCTYTVI